MAALLSKAAKDLIVTVLLDALQQTKDFELSMVKKFGAPVNPASGHVEVGISKTFTSYRTFSRRHRQRRHDPYNQSARLLSHTWVCMYNIKTSESSLVPLGVRT